ncbi:DUF1206 domain-containing protein [Nocardioides mesophilus]|uniref:DUF1206 domain-containing protein n=1 Tax=Nocardioides mesophilus TaxID=433659 RepID=A0A7G9REV6_9ACTN|nr:DUF1206 domain-containing protein [Nocardioides mesophilus]QNN54131.1 DUF1206 domain-containing protein [Nocardioides mesophilus]
MELSASGIDRKADHSDMLDNAVRVGLVSYGVEHLLLAWLALQLVFGDRSGEASASGALHQLAETTLGRLSLYVVAAGFLALVIWQGIEAVVGHRDEDGGKRTFKRIVSAGKVVLYVVLGLTALRIATGSGGGKGSSTETLTAKLMAAPGGQLLVGLVGVGVIATGGMLAWRGWKEKFRSKLDVDGTTGNDGHAYILFGKIGYLAKGAALVLVGLLFVLAAVTHDPDKSGGLDQALTKLLAQPFGQVGLLVIAAGIACYGLFCFAWARHLDR